MGMWKWGTLGSVGSTQAAAERTQAAAERVSTEAGGNEGYVEARVGGRARWQPGVCRVLGRYTKGHEGGQGHAQGGCARGWYPGAAAGAAGLYI